MNSRLWQIFYILLAFIVPLIFIISCIITLSDAQGSFVFIFSIPLMIIMIVSMNFLARKIQIKSSFRFIPKVTMIFMITFFTFSFIPGLRLLPDTFMVTVGKVFHAFIGKTPREYFQERASFENKLKEALKEHKTIIFHDLNVTFAWDRVCLFGPYTNNSQAKSVHKLDWNIEDHSQIYQSDSINTLVFIFEGKVNKVVELKRGVVDFKTLDRCLLRDEAKFDYTQVVGGVNYLKAQKLQ